jgi:hypothetical protein
MKNTRNTNIRTEERYTQSTDIGSEKRNRYKRKENERRLLSLETDTV